VHTRAFEQQAQRVEQIGLVVGNQDARLYVTGGRHFGGWGSKAHAMR
jgi:hypothetical protein